MLRSFLTRGLNTSLEVVYCASTGTIPILFLIKLIASSEVIDAPGAAPFGPQASLAASA